MNNKTSGNTKIQNKSCLVARVFLTYVLIALKTSKNRSYRILNQLYFHRKMSETNIFLLNFQLYKQKFPHY